MNLTEIANRCKDGDRDAFGLIYNATRPALKRVALRYVKDSDTADDVLHDGYLIAFTSIGTLKDPSKIEGWLSSIIKNLALQELKSRENQAAAFIPVEEIQDMPDISDFQAENRGLSMEDLEILIGKLPDGYGKVFRLSVLEGLSHKEIGRRLGIAPNSSSSQLYHAKTMLRRLISQYRLQLGVMFAIAVISGVLRNVVVNMESDVNDSVYVSATGEEPAHSEDEPSNLDEPSKPSKNRHAIASGPKRSVQIYPAREADMNDSDKLETDETVAQNYQPQFESDKEESSVRNNSTQEADSINFGAPEWEHVLTEKKQKRPAGSNWSIAMVYSGSMELGAGSERLADTSSDISPILWPNWNWGHAIHHVPLTFGLSVEKSLSSRFSLETGISYTYLRTDRKATFFVNDVRTESTQRIHYIGIPLKINYRMADFNRLSMYLQGGVQADIPVYGAQKMMMYEQSSETFLSERARHIHPPVLWSSGIGLGIQYHLTPYIGIYTEPSLKYYISTSSDIKTKYTDEPLQFVFPIGLRFSW